MSLAVASFFSFVIKGFGDLNSGCVPLPTPGLVCDRGGPREAWLAPRGRVCAWLPAAGPGSSRAKRPTVGGAAAAPALLRPMGTGPSSSLLGTLCLCFVAAFRRVAFPEPGRGAVEVPPAVPWLSAP